MIGSDIKLPTLKQIIAGLLAVLTMISSMIFGGKFGKVEIEIKDEITTETQTIEFNVLNYSLKEIVTDESFTLEKNNNGKWEKVNFSDDYVIHDLAVVIKGIHSSTFKIDLIKAFGKTLDKGEYRITKEIGGKEYSVSFGVTALNEVTTTAAA